ncbi:MAG: hydroxymethylglutaryl-CoA reductase [Candidatus Levybacteria bacterium]|nr:hydroxymethylglutaryl-CoA reductase [Candidatus Levybacteria bacterium]
MNVRDYKDTKSRRDALEKELDVQLPHIASYTKDLEIATTKNCENMIGAAQIPLGIAGPLRISSARLADQISNDENVVVRTRQAKPYRLAGTKQSLTNEEFLRDRVADARDDSISDYYLPLATTEGALVASISRGCKAITEAGGAIVDIHKIGMTRGPVFYTGSIKQMTKLYEFIKKHEARINKQAESTSHHLKLKKMMVKSLPNYTFLRLVYDTEDAMGMNMATIATQAAVEFIEKETGIPCLSVAGNFDVDKKPAWLNSIEGRGMKAWAEIVLPKEVVADVLKTTPQKFFDVWLAKVMLGSAVSGSIGFNAHIANVISALFVATGQDPAHVVEGSLGITTAKVLKNGDLYVGVFLPSLLVGTVGGGTSLPTQGEALRILGVSGEGKVEEFAGIVAAACLAGEISLLASLSEGSLAESHKRLGREK